MLALRQPMAQGSAADRRGAEDHPALERIGDYAANVAKRSIVLAQYSLPFSLSGLAHMTRLVQENLKPDRRRRRR